MHRTTLLNISNGYYDTVPVGVLDEWVTSGRESTHRLHCVQAERRYNFFSYLLLALLCNALKSDRAVQRGGHSFLKALEGLVVRTHRFQGPTEVVGMWMKLIEDIRVGG